MGGQHKAHKLVLIELLIDPEGREQGEEIFTQGRHKATYLAEIVIDFSKRRGRDLGVLQRKALRRFHHFNIFDLKDKGNKISIIDILSAYYTLFDELFFFGSLWSRCKPAFRGDTTAKESYCNGETRHRLGIFLEPKKKLAIDIFSQDDIKTGRYNKLKMYVSTLLHEMIHAFQML